MRISDWSSDVCSSDLTPGRNHRNPHKSNRKQFRPFDAGAYSRAGYYRHWQARAPCREETDLQDAIQRLALANRRFCYRRITALPGREGRPVNPQRVLWLMRVLGRAPCRERECQRVSTSVVAVLFKKKKQIN